jgi:FixJ family two-component response regulator
VAHIDKYLAPGDKPAHCARTYKARFLNQEPERAPMELTTRTLARTPGRNGMEKNRRTIAIIDDDNGIRQSLKRMLTTAGFRVQVYSGAEEFLDALDECVAGCAIVDLELGAMSGFDLARHPAMVAAALPIIFISGTHSETARASALALGAVEFLRKPFMPIELLGAIFRATQDAPTIS